MVILRARHVGHRVRAVVHLAVVQVHLPRAAVRVRPPPAAPRELVVAMVPKVHRRTDPLRRGVPPARPPGAVDDDEPLVLPGAVVGLVDEDVLVPMGAWGGHADGRHPRRPRTRVDGERVGFGGRGAHRGGDARVVGVGEEARHAERVTGRGEVGLDEVHLRRVRVERAGHGHGGGGGEGHVELELVLVPRLIGGHSGHRQRRVDLTRRRERRRRGGRRRHRGGRRRRALAGGRIGRPGRRTRVLRLGARHEEPGDHPTSGAQATPPTADR